MTVAMDPASETESMDDEELLEFLYLCPFGLLQLAPDGRIQLMNSVVAQIFMPLVPDAQVENFFDVLDRAAPELRRKALDYPRERGSICHAVRVDFGLLPGRTIELVLEVSVLKISPARLMAVIDDISQLDADKRAQEAALKEAYDEKSLVLRSISDGLVTLDHDGCLWGELSAMLQTWFGVPTEPQTFWRYIESSDPQAAINFALGWQAVQDDVLPLELVMDQMPRRIMASGRTLRAEYRPVLRESAGQPRFHKLVIILTDISSEIERERLEAEQRELAAAIDRLLRNRSAFLGFLQEAEALVAQIVAPRRPPLVDLARQIHTLKGNSAIFGLERLSALCHTLEDRLRERQDDLFLDEREELRRRWRMLYGHFAGLLGQRGRVEISEVEHAHLLAALRADIPRADIADLVETWRYPPAQALLTHLGDQARELGRRLGKQVAVEVRCGALRLDPARFGGFFAALVHVVRNALDHGLEPPEERRHVGKDEVGRLRLYADATPEGLLVEIADDGRGIDWVRLRDKALQRGLPVADQADLVEALFCDGVSTRDEVSELSGRGVGMAAVRATCLDLGGKIEVRSQVGQGTCFRFRFLSLQSQARYVIAGKNHETT